MHLEPLEKLPRSVREFLSHYAMIVVSILTALALEEAALSLQHRHEGARAKEEIEQEIASNHQQALESLRATEANVRAWEALLDRTLAAIKDGSSTNASRVAALRDSGPLFRDSLPSLKTTAWDAALSDHSVNYLNHEDLSRYSELYAIQHTFTLAMWDVLRDSAVRDTSQIRLAVSLDKADAYQTASTLNSRMQTISILESQLAQLETALREAHTGGGDNAAPATATAGSAVASH